MTVERDETAERPRRRVAPQDGITFLLGVYLTLAPIWTDGAPWGWFVTLGVLIAVVALWALGTAASAGSEIVQVLLGVATFLSPWIGGFAGAAGAPWTAWIIGVVVIALAVTAMATARARATAGPATV